MSHAFNATLEKTWKSKRHFGGHLVFLVVISKSLIHSSEIHQTKGTPPSYWCFDCQFMCMGCRSRWIRGCQSWPAPVLPGRLTDYALQGGMGMAQLKYRNSAKASEEYSPLGRWPNPQHNSQPLLMVSRHVWGGDPVKSTLVKCRVGQVSFDTPYQIWASFGQIGEWTQLCTDVSLTLLGLLRKHFESVFILIRF